MCEPIGKNVNLLNINTIPEEKPQSTSIEKIIRVNHLNNEERKSILKLCRQYDDIFQRENQDLTFTNRIQHRIDTDNDIPIFTKSYRYPYIHKTEVEQQVHKMLTQGIIKPSFSPWSSPVWIVPKKEDASGKVKWRMVIDYRKLNDKTKEDKYPIPNITDILDKLGRCQYFTTLDLASGFHQIEVAPEHQEKTAFSVEFGHYEYARMPFGLKNAPATFQRVMDNVLGELQGKTCLCYMDDIIIFSTSLQEHIENLAAVFKKLQIANLKVQMDKSEFLQREVAFLGHIITAEGVKPNPAKIKSIQQYPLPKTEKQIKSFLGLVGYYRKFIKNFAQLTKPMTKYLRKGEKLNIEDRKYLDCFETCKQILTKDPILQFPDFNKEFKVTTDASNFAIGAILSQGEVGSDLPICYASRTLNASEQNYSTIEKELLAIVWAIKYFRPYLFGRKFCIITDHKPLTWLFSLKEPNSKLIRWRLKLEEYDYKIVYKKGIKNANADALSRIQINTSETNTTSSDNIPLARFKGNASETSNEDTPNMVSIPGNLIPTTKNCLNTFDGQLILYQGPEFQPTKKIEKTIFGKKRIIIWTAENPIGNSTIRGALQNLRGRGRKLTCVYSSDEGFKRILNIYNKMINSKPRIEAETKVNLVRSLKFLKDLETEELQQETIEKIHKQNEHRGINENYEQMKNQYYFPNMKETIRIYVNNCDVCQQAKYERTPPKIKFMVTETPKKPMEIIHVDTLFMGKEIFLTIIDKFSKFGCAYNIDKNTGKIITSKLKNYFSIHGIPTKIIGDHEIQQSNDIKALLRKYNITLHETTAFNSTGNSTVERFHSTLKELCTIIRLNNKNDLLHEIMNTAIIAYNNAIHSATKLTPFQLLKGHYSDQPTFGTEIEYATKLKQHCEQLYNNMYNLQKEKKEKIINRLNQSRNEPIQIPPNLPIYVKRYRRGKLIPRFRKQITKEPISITKPIINTNFGKVHKNKVKRLFQVTPNPRTTTKNHTTEEQ